MTNAIVKDSLLHVFIKQHCAESVCLYYGLRVYRQNYIIIIMQCGRKFIKDTNSSLSKEQIHQASRLDNAIGLLSIISATD